MKAMIFAAGLGTRLKPLTDTMPKAMVSVAGKPLLGHVIEKLKNAGVTDIIINLHHFADQIIDYIAANNSFSVNIEFSDETDCLLDTGGGIKHASWFFDERPFIVHNVDIFSDIDLGDLYKHHLKTKADATLLVSNRETARYLLFDDSMGLRGWINKKTGEVKSPVANFDSNTHTRFAFSGIQILSPSVLMCMNQFPQRFSIIDFYLSVCKDIAVKSFVPTKMHWLDVGKIDSLKDAEKFLRHVY